jgi:hypothetical protein
MAWISVRDPTNITTVPVSSSKFDFNIRLTIALQLLERFRLWVKLRRTQYEHMFSALPFELGHCSMQSICLKRANERHQSGVDAGLWEPHFLQHPG